MKFCGKFKGCCKETIVNYKGVAECEYKAEIKIINVNCSQKTAFLIKINDQTGEYENLTYLEDFGKHILRSPTSCENGVASTYFKDKYLIHQVSMHKKTSKGIEWIVKYYKMKPILNT